MLLNTDVVIIGGGLSGLSLAHHLQNTGIDYQLFEARPELGGRIKAGGVGHENRRGVFDLGPAWFWPGQPRMYELVTRLGLKTFDQFASGTLSYEDEKGDVFRNQGFASMEGSFRIEGGITGVIQGLYDRLDQERVHLNAPIHSLKQNDAVEGIAPDGAPLFQAQRVVLALPPRIAEKISYHPPLPDAATQALRSIPTWMAGHAKVLTVYETPFWREAGLSGDAMSRFGPMVEIHDATDPISNMGALFGFVGVAAEARAGQEDTLKNAAVEQLVRIFGPKAENPLELLYQDWAVEVETATKDDLAPMYEHPTYGLPLSAKNLWDNCLFFGSTEIAPEFGGYLEGALEAAEIVTAQLTSEG
jgi:monoamine oxidase